MATEREAVTAAEIIRNFGYWQQQALSHPITITHHGRARVLLISADEYERLRHTPALQGGVAVPTSHRVHASLLLENMAEGFLLVSPEMRIIEMNRVAEAFSGVERERTLGQSPADFFLDSVQSVIIERLQRVLRTGEISSMEATSAIHGSRVVSLRMFPVGENVGVLFTNITEQEQMRDAIGEYRACADIASVHRQVSLSRLDSRGRILSADAQFAELTGFTADELSQVKLFDIVASSHRKKLLTAFEDMMSRREQVVMDVRVMVKQGGERLVQISMAPLTRDFAAYAAMVLMTASSGESADDA